MTLILDKAKAALLLHSLDLYCCRDSKKSKKKLARGRATRYKEYANKIIARYGAVILVDGSDKYLCNNPKYLRKWADSFIHNKENTLIAPNCGRQFKQQPFKQ